MSPSYVSKVNTALYLGLMATSLMAAAWPALVPACVSVPVVVNAWSWLVAGTTVVSGTQYLLSAKDALRPIAETQTPKASKGG